MVFRRDANYGEEYELSGSYAPSLRVPLAVTINYSVAIKVFPYLKMLLPL